MHVGAVEVSVVKGDISRLDVQAVVNPANTHLEMGGGVAGQLKAAGGAAVQRAARDAAPVEVGEAAVTTAGDLPAQAIVHAPTVHDPGDATDAGTVRRAMTAALEAAAGNGIRQLAVPALGTGAGGVATDAAVEAMLDAVAAFEGGVEAVVLVAYDDAVYRAFRTALESRTE